MLMLAVPGTWGFRLSLGYEVPSMSKLHQAAMAYGLQFGPEDEFFMVGSAWMLYYAPGRPKTEFLRCYDRDYRVVYEDKTFEQILGEAWELLSSA